MRDTQEEFEKGDTDKVFKYCMGKVFNCFIKKCDARKQKSYMRAVFLKPKSSYVDAMSFRLKILNNYHSRFLSPDKSHSNRVR